MINSIKKKNKVLIVAIQDNRRRYRFILEPLVYNNFKPVLFLDNDGLISFVKRSLKTAINNKDIKTTILYGGDFKNLFWCFLSRYIIGSKIILRLGGDLFEARKKMVKTALYKRKYYSYLKLNINYLLTKIVFYFVDIFAGYVNIIRTAVI